MKRFALVVPLAILALAGCIDQPNPNQIDWENKASLQCLLSCGPPNPCAPGFCCVMPPPGLPPQCAQCVACGPHDLGIRDLAVHDIGPPPSLDMVANVCGNGICESNFNGYSETAANCCDDCQCPEFMGAGGGVAGTAPRPLNWVDPGGDSPPHLQNGFMQVAMLCSNGTHGLGDTHDHQCHPNEGGNGVHNKCAEMYWSQMQTNNNVQQHDCPVKASFCGGGINPTGLQTCLATPRWLTGHTPNVVTANLWNALRSDVTNGKIVNGMHLNCYNDATVDDFFDVQCDSYVKIPDLNACLNDY